MKRYVNLFFDEAMLARIDRFWHVNRFISRTGAIRWLINYALEQKPKVPTGARGIRKIPPTPPPPDEGEGLP